VLISDDTAAPSNKQKRIARTKVHQLSAYWAGQGLEFELVDTTVPLERRLPPARSMLTIGEFTGSQLVSDVPFKLEVTLSITPTGGTAHPETLALDVPSNQTPSLLGAGIAKAVSDWKPTAGALQGLVLQAATFDIATPRVLQSLPQPPLTSSGVADSVALKRLGSRGPVDVVIAPAGSSTVGDDGPHVRYATRSSLRYRLRMRRP
jgi:hypothetical protein